MTRALVDHDLVGEVPCESVRYERRPLVTEDGVEIDGLWCAWIWIDNEKELNALTAESLKELFLALRRASNDRAVVVTVLTAVGTRAFSTGGNVREYVESYVGRPQEYRQYLRLFNDVVTAILHSDKPVVNRVNGMRVGGGQEIGMACDLSIASDLAVFGQAGPKHGSAPIAGATDFLPLLVGYEHATRSAALCETMSAHKACRLGLVSQIVPALVTGGGFVANPLVVTDRWLDEYGRVILGERKTGAALEEARALVASGKIDLSLLDREVERVEIQFAATMPECLLRTLEGIRHHKLLHWNLNAQSARSWLAVNMATEARAGFRAFHERALPDRTIDFLELRREMAAGRPWDDSLVADLLTRRET